MKFKDTDGKIVTLCNPAKLGHTLIITNLCKEPITIYPPSREKVSIPIEWKYYNGIGMCLVWDSRSWLQGIKAKIYIWWDKRFGKIDVTFDKGLFK